LRIQTLVLIPTLDNVKQQVEALLIPFDCYSYQLLLAKEDVAEKMQELGANNEEEFIPIFEAYITETEPLFSHLIIEDGNYFNVMEVGGEFSWYDIGGRYSGIFDKIKQSSLGLDNTLEPHVCLVSELLADTNKECAVIVSEKTGWLDADQVDNNWQQQYQNALNQHLDFYAVYVVCKG